MPITAKLRHLRISPRKVRLVTNLVKGLSVQEAEKQLKFLSKRAARPILKLLNSAMANAQHNANLTKEGLYIKNIVVEPGPTLKRWRPRAMGRATPIMKRTSHITILLEQSEGAVVPPTKPTEVVSPVPAKKEEVKAEPVKEKAKPAEKEEPLLLEEIQRLEKEKEPVAKPKPAPPVKPYPTTSQAKKKFFSRQTFGNVKKYFRRKSL